jgi:hypothetical protein
MAIIRSANSEQQWEPQPWGATSALIQDWVNELIWTTLRLPTEAPEAPSLQGLPAEALANLRAVITHNRLEGFVLAVWGDKLRKALGDEFHAQMTEARRRTEIFIQEIYWILGPALGAQVVLLDDFAMRSHYARFAQDGLNPRLLSWLVMWAPTLSTREEIARTLADGGFDPDGTESEGYTYCKTTDGVLHKITVLGCIWDATRNWSRDLEREVWDRTRDLSPEIPMRPEPTDQFILTMRRFAVDSLSGGALLLRDLVTLCERGPDEIDWSRLRHVKEAFHRPDWLWASFRALSFYEKKTSTTLPFPEWVREGLTKSDPFWNDFVESRLNWANPDLRLIDFSRAYVMAERGT